jgi:hypothetical protein
MSDEDDTNDDMNSAQMNFEAERDKILSELPPVIRDSFGFIGFFLVEDNGDDDDDEDDDDEDKAKKGASTPTPTTEYYQPALIVSPFDVPPKPVRDIYWMDMFTKAKRSKAKLAAMDYLVYLYGSHDADDCYNFVAQDELVSFKDAQEQGLDQLPVELEEKQKSGVKLTHVESTLIRGYEEMKVDIDKEPQDRKPNAKFAFVERHEVKKVASDGPPRKKQKA